jgi:class 3 adenylate cyclase
MLTYLFTDVPGSGALWEEVPDATARAMARHDLLVEAAVARHGGRVVRPRGEGDGRFAVFACGAAGLAAAADIVRALAAEDWPTPRPIEVRAAIHTGDAELRAGDYYGPAVNRAARLRSIAHPGQVLVSAAASVSLPDGLSLRNLGLHGLRDVPEPERVFQLLVPGLPDEFPPLLSLEPARHNLPHQLDDFVGREDERDRLEDLLRRHRLVTLVGRAGVGKTRLALQIATHLLDTYPDGAWMAELDGLERVEDVAAAVASAAEGRGQRVLLLLDHADDATAIATAVLVPELLRAAPDRVLLVTARMPLGVAGEHVFPVSGLPFPDPAAALPPEELRSYAAVRLFLDRAHAVRPGFVLDADNAAAIAELCAELDGVPAALEQAATRLRALSPLQVVERLKRRALLRPA